MAPIVHCKATVNILSGKLSLREVLFVFLAPVGYDWPCVHELEGSTANTEG